MLYSTFKENVRTKYAHFQKKKEKETNKRSPIYVYCVCYKSPRRNYAANSESAQPVSSVHSTSYTLIKDGYYGNQSLGDRSEKIFKERSTDECKFVHF